jgi:hypothetical protein
VNRFVTVPTIDEITPFSPGAFVRFGAAFGLAFAAFAVTADRSERLFDAGDLEVLLVALVERAGFDAGVFFVERAGFGADDFFAADALEVAELFFTPVVFFFVELFFAAELFEDFPPDEDFDFEAVVFLVVAIFVFLQLFSIRLIAE